MNRAYLVPGGDVRGRGKGEGSCPGGEIQAVEDFFVRILPVLVAVQVDPGVQRSIIKRLTVWAA